MENLLMNGSSSTLDGAMSTEVEVELKWMSAARLNEGSWDGIAIAIAFATIREEADMMALAGDNNRKLGDHLAANLAEALLHITDLFFKNGGVLTLGNTWH
jgi:hypothetical protein